MITKRLKRMSLATFVLQFRERAVGIPVGFLQTLLLHLVATVEGYLLSIGNQPGCQSFYTLFFFLSSQHCMFLFQLSMSLAGFVQASLIFVNNVKGDRVEHILGLYYKTYYSRNLRIFVINQSAGAWQAFPTQSNVCG